MSNGLKTAHSPEHGELGAMVDNTYHVRPRAEGQGHPVGTYRWVLGTTEGASLGVAAHLDLAA